MSQRRWIGDNAGHGVIALGYILLFVLLDNLAYRRTGISSDDAFLSLNAGLAYVLILQFGRKQLVTALCAPLISEWILNQSDAPFLLEMIRDLAVGAMTAAGALVLSSRRLRFDPSLGTMRDLVSLFAVAIGQALCVAIVIYGVLVLTRPPSMPANWRDILDIWVAQFLGVLMVAPLGLYLLRGRWHVLRPLDWLVHLGSILIVFLCLAVFDRTQPFQSFYVFSLPILWMVVRGGIEAASVGLAMTQAGLIVAARTLPNAVIDVPSLQIRLLVLTVTALVIGAVVVERLRIERQLRRHQEAVEKMARIASMSQLASSIAHEINQPLMAAGTYARHVARVLETGSPNPAAALESAQKASEQIARAGEVVHRLKALFKIGKTTHRLTPLAEIVQNAQKLLQTDLENRAVTCTLRMASPVVWVMADTLQLEQVFLNLIQNAAQAVHGQGHIEISIEPLREGIVDVVIADDGPGLPPELTDGVPVPFFSTKDSGIGVGLALSRTIVEAHDGKLKLRNGPTGARIVVSLPATLKGP